MVIKKIVIELNGSEIELEVTKRSHDFHVCKKGNNAAWECGKTLEKAANNWSKTHCGNWSATGRGG